MDDETNDSVHSNERKGSPALVNLHSFVIFRPEIFSSSERVRGYVRNVLQGRSSPLQSGMTSFLPRTRRLADLWRLTFWRKGNVLESRSKDRRSRSRDDDDDDDDNVPEKCATSPPDDNDPCDPICHPPSKLDPSSCTTPKPPTCHPDADPRKLAFWRTMSLYVALPLVAIMSLITYARVKERSKQPRQPYQDLPYMCRRTKPFPWGDGNHTLFHNPVKNPVPPHGYEVEDPNAPVYKEAAN